MTSQIAQIFTDVAHRYTSARRRDAAWEDAWKSVDAPDAFAESFSRIRVVCDRRLNASEAEQMAGCLAYALRAGLAGDEMGQPEVSYAIAKDGIKLTVLEADYDSESTIRTDPNPSETFALARLYISEGTPIRKTNRVAASGTRLVEGISPCNLSIYVR